MIRSVAGTYRDIICMLPVSNLNAKLQYELWLKNFKVLDELGFVVPKCDQGHSFRPLHLDYSMLWQRT